MKKKLIVLTVLTLMLCAACVTAGCMNCNIFSGITIESNYTITFKNYDGSVLQSGKIDRGEMPQYEGETPQKPSTNEYDYTFIGWSPKIALVTKAATYTAQFESAKRSGYQRGEGSENNPYIIQNALQLTFFANQVTAGQRYVGKYLALSADIDLGGEEWTPIGTSGSLFFAGNFDGDGFVVKNFVITPTIDGAGLFGYSRGTIQNLGVTDFTINTTLSSFVAYVGGLVGINDGGTITNCYVTGNVTATSTSYAYAGGLVGINSGGTITNCYATGNVTATASYDDYAGGLIGYNFGTITNCYASGDISANSTFNVAYAGGLVGDNDGTITNCYATGDISSTSSYYAYAGGLVGYNQSSAITNCYATGDISANSSSHYAYAGGLVGYNEDGAITNCYATGDVSSTSSYYAYAGGLVGYNEDGAITNCYATGDLSVTSTNSTARAGGLVGWNVNGTIINCYATGDISATASSSYVYAYAYAGGLVGFNWGGTIANCYRYDGQTFYRKEGSTEYNTANNDEGEPCGKDDLNSAAFYTATLEWDEDIWDFSALDFDLGLYPTLK